jgi:hypothetical protein
VQCCDVMFTVTSSMNAVLHKVYKYDVGSRGGGLKSLKIGSLDK